MSLPHVLDLLLAELVILNTLRHVISLVNLLLEQWCSEILRSLDHPLNVSSFDRLDFLEVIFEGLLHVGFVTDTLSLILNLSLALLRCSLILVQMLLLESFHGFLEVCLVLSVVQVSQISLDLNFHVHIEAIVVFLELCCVVHSCLLAFKLGNQFETVMLAQ